mmetsp:Transcript_28559/g.59515  ORF Transcript_28559/g.59515 Transcript_28559/m.59515 type:complete len:289 (+) Transcript_28559:334-1200(+)
MVTLSNSLDSHSELVVVQVCEFMTESGQCIDQRNLHGDIQMITIPVVVFILLLNNYKIEITSIHTRLLIRYSLECNWLSRVHSLLHVNGKFYLLRLGLPIRTLPTVITPHLALRYAPLITLLNLLHEPGRNLLHLDLDSRTLTLLLIFHAILPVHAKRLSNILDLDCFAEIELLQSQAEWDVDIGSGLLPLPTAPASESTASEAEVAEDVVESAVAPALSLSLLMLLQTFLAVTIVNLLLLLVGQYLVGVGDLGKLIGGSFFLILVGVEFERFGTVCFFYFLRSCVAF